ncbi:MAG: hypothetical protein QOC80_2322, partial [Frankiaceae bacterium]|nr:hypothetical protein [Frankiaceae bacterium]
LLAAATGLRSGIGAGALVGAGSS